MTGSSKLLTTAVSVGLFIGGWRLIAQHESAAQVQSLDLQPQAQGIPPTATLVLPTVPPWPTIEPLAMFPAVPTVAPLPPGRFARIEQSDGAADLAISQPVAVDLAPLPTLAPLPAMPSPPPAPPSFAAAPRSDLQVAPGSIGLAAPLGGATAGPTSFEWIWKGAIPANHGFEVMVWRSGEPPAGAHDAVADNLSGRIQRVGDDRYRLHIDIENVAGVRGRGGDYFWTVALVQISPTYQNLGIQAQPTIIRLDLGGGGGSSNGGGSQQTKGS